jgi:hypothetical protein
MNENTGNLKPLQIINPNTGRKIFIGTKTYKDLQNQGLIPKDTVFNSKKLAKAEPLFKVMNKSMGSKNKTSSGEQSSKTKSKTHKHKPYSEGRPLQDKVDSESDSSSDNDLDNILSKAFGSEAQAFQTKTKTKMKQLPPTPSSSDSESESNEDSDSDSSS